MGFNAYLNFGGNCREAFARYQEVFGGELFVQTLGEAPPQEGFEVAPEQKDLVMHAALMLEDGILMASDAMSPDFGPVQGMYVIYTTKSPEDAQRIFEALAEGGTVEMPAEPTFWSPMFGVCVDRFGTPWMVNAESSESDSAG